MKIALVCNKSEESARCDQLVGYNQVYAWHLRDALRRAGTEAVLSKDRDLPNLEESTAAQGVAEDTDVFWCVEPALVPCPVRCRILFEMVLELLSAQEGGKELLKGDLTWSL